MTIDNRQQLLNTINSQITLNGTGAITGPILNNVLDTMVNSALFYAGNWSAYTNYSPLDVVVYNGTSYTALVTNVNVTPSSNPTIWGPLVIATPSLFQTDALTVVSTNTLSSLSQTPAYQTGVSSGLFLLTVNGQTFVPAGASPAFSVAGTTVTWLSTTFGLSTFDTVFAVYTY